MNASGFSYRGPAEFIRKKRTQERKGVSWRLVGGHYVWRILTGDRGIGDLHTSRKPDDKWHCPTCRIGKVDDYVRRIAASFEELPMLVEVVDRDRIEAIRGRVRRRGLSYWKIPIGLQVVFLLDGPLTDNSEEVYERRLFLRDVLNLKDGGNISSSGRFRTPETDPEYWEAYHLDTARRCGHLHETHQSAVGCANETGWRLDGSTHHWYVRGASRYQSLGSLGVRDTDSLQGILGELGIEYALMKGFVRISLIAWDDERFVEFRHRADWRRPPRSRDDWVPLIYPVEIVVSDRGEIAAVRATEGDQ